MVSHWQQSFGPGVLLGVGDTVFVGVSVGVSVGVAVSGPPASTLAGTIESKKTAVSRTKTAKGRRDCLSAICTHLRIPAVRCGHGSADVHGWFNYITTGGASTGKFVKADVSPLTCGAVAVGMAGSEHPCGRLAHSLEARVQLCFGLSQVREFSASHPLTLDLREFWRGTGLVTAPQPAQAEQPNDTQDAYQHERHAR